MTDLKRVSASTATEKEDVAYLWVRTRRSNGKKKRASVSAGASARRSDPLSFPWGDIVETPMRVLRRMFNLD